MLYATPGTKVGMPAQQTRVSAGPAPASALPPVGANIVQIAGDTYLGPPIDWNSIPIRTTEEVSREMISAASLDNTRDDLAFDAFDADLFRGGLSGIGSLGATKKKVVAPPATVSRSVPQPVKQSTMYLVLGGAAVAIAAGVALWMWGKSK